MDSIQIPELLPGDTSLESRQKRLSRFWQDVWALDDPGAITWDVWEEYSSRVTDLLYDGATPENVLQAESLTAEAYCRYVGLA